MQKVFHKVSATTALALMLIGGALITMTLMAASANMTGGGAQILPQYQSANSGMILAPLRAAAPDNGMPLIDRIMLGTLLMVMGYALHRATDVFPKNVSIHRNTSRRKYRRGTFIEIIELPDYPMQSR